MANFLKKVIIFGLTFGAASMVWRAATMERNAGRRAPSSPNREQNTLDELSTEEQELLLKELASQL